jgi:hypothetical protein
MFQFLMKTKQQTYLFLKFTPERELLTLAKTKNQKQKVENKKFKQSSKNANFN